MQNNKKTKILLISLLSAIIILALALIILNKTTQNTDNITFTIVNKSEYFPEATDSQKTELENSILTYEKSHYDLSSSVDDASIVPQYYYHYLDDNIHSAQFILEIPSLGQSLKIYYTWSKEDSLADTLVISCPLASETSYQDFVCYDTLTETAIKISNNIESQTEIIVSGLDYLGERGVKSAVITSIYEKIITYFKQNSPSSLHAILQEQSFSRNVQEETFSFTLLVDNETVYTVEVLDSIISDLNISIFAQ